MARLRSIAKLHNLAAGSQTIPNSVAEAAAAQGKCPQVGPSTAIALPAPERKKLAPKRGKRKIPRVVSDEEEDESTEDGLVYKRKKATVAGPLAVGGTSPNYTENPQRLHTFRVWACSPFKRLNCWSCTRTTCRYASFPSTYNGASYLTTAPRGPPRHPIL